MKILNRTFLLTLILLSGCPRKDLEKEVKTLIEQEEYKKAGELLTRQDTSNTLVKILLGDVYTMEGKYERALRIYRGLKPETPRLINRLISSLATLGQTAYELEFRLIAKASYEKILELDPTFDLGEGFRFLGNYYLNEDSSMVAQRYYTLYLERGGNLKNILPFYVRVLYSNQEYEKIVVLHKEVIALEHAEASWILGNAYLEVGKMYYQEEQFDSAQIFLEQLVEFKIPKEIMPEAYFILGNTYETSGDTLGAIKAYREVLALGKSPFRDNASARVKVLSKFY